MTLFILGALTGAAVTIAAIEIVTICVIDRKKKEEDK